MTTVDVFYTAIEAMVFIQNDKRDNLFYRKELDGLFHVYEGDE